MFAMSGTPAIAERLLSYRIVQNNAFDPATQVQTGVTSRGHEIWLNREIAACDVKVLTGFIEPHFFAGFSGGGKALMPGMAGQRTVLGNHDAGMIANPNATWGVTHGNPIWEEVMEVAAQRGRSLPGQRDAQQAQGDHRRLCRRPGPGPRGRLRACARHRDGACAPQLRHRRDDQLRLSAGHESLPGGEGHERGRAGRQGRRRHPLRRRCADGIPEHGLYGQLLREAASPRELLDRIMAPGFLMQDQWQAQIQAQIQLRAAVYVYADYLTDEQIRGALFLPCRDLSRRWPSCGTQYGPAGLDLHLAGGTADDSVCEKPSVKDTRMHYHCQKLDQRLHP